MKKTAIIIIALFSLLKAYSHDWHTEPGKWKEARIFHSDFDDEFDSKIRVSKTELKDNVDSKEYSSNKAYWFVVYKPETKVKGPWSTEIEIYTERDYLIKIDLIDHAAQYEIKIEWINEKLLYVRFWWGRVVGTDFIYDVEKEMFISREMIFDGNNAFKQWKQGMANVQPKTPANPHTSGPQR
ncbi:hypothetical protein P3T73_17920 [Kiritimatiellota bacterium B12222]|nr:hypothetical protein P3T73_17920 [Kiritimatiellota bacterium B12222]